MSLESFYDPISVAEFCADCIKDTKQGLERGVVRHCYNWIKLRGCQEYAGFPPVAYAKTK